MLYLQLFEKMSIVALAAYVFSQTILFKRFFTRKLYLDDYMLLIMFFSILSILGTYLGIKVQGGAIANIRPIGAIVAGLVGGPVIGGIVGLIAGVHRYTLGGFTAVACAYSTIAEGLIGGYFKKYLYKNNNTLILSFIAGVVAEIAQVIIVILVAKPYVAAVELEKLIGLPMILINAIGVALFINIIDGVKWELNRVAAFNAFKALNIAKRTSLYTKSGLNKESAREIANIISEETGANCVFICDINGILYSTKNSDSEIKEMLKDIDNNIKCQLVNFKDKCFYIIKFYSQQNEFNGVLGVELKNCNDTNKYYFDFLEELGELMSMQLEINRLNKIAQNAYKSELKALKAQIHPHFLFNALNTIASFCRTNPIKARELILNLSNYFRSTLKRDDDFVKVSDELDLINSYINIEKARFGERLNYYSEVDERILNNRIPGFILQPIVENSIKHGISPKAVGGSVFLKASIEENYMLFVIEDTGVGLSSVEDNFLNKGEGIGISNIKERLNLYYNKDFKFIMDSSIEGGAKTIIKIPITEAEK